MTLELPMLPPSTNNLYFNAAGKGRIKTRQYNDWLTQCGLLLKRQVTGRLTGRVDIRIQLEDKHPLRDCDNATKPICDLLVKLGAIQDDRSKFVRSVKAEWAPIKGIIIEIMRCAA
jgi:Holliday junction resolvase RusA-like endonuclease